MSMEQSDGNTRAAGGQWRVLQEGWAGWRAGQLGWADTQGSSRLGNYIPNSSGVSGKASLSMAPWASLLPKLGPQTAADCLMATV